MELRKLDILFIAYIAIDALGKLCDLAKEFL